jgi:hypothetical protein
MINQELFHMLSLKTYILSFQIIIHTLQKRMFFSVHKQKKRKRTNREQRI